MNYFQLQHSLQPDVLDALLAKGFYRMQQTVFTTSAIFIDNRVIEVLWIRIQLDIFKTGKRFAELSKRSKHFQITLSPAVINEEINELYTQYYASVDFEAPETVASFLMGDETINYFPTKMWQIRDCGKLIAVGYFDEGSHTAAGIMNFYHPDYKKYSFGTLLYYKSILQAKETGKNYFYPGYIAIGYPKFDYKLLPGADCIEYWDAARQLWKPYSYSFHALQ